MLLLKIMIKWHSFGLTLSQALQEHRCQESGNRNDLIFGQECIGMPPVFFMIAYFRYKELDTKVNHLLLVDIVE